MSNFNNIDIGLLRFCLQNADGGNTNNVGDNITQSNNNRDSRDYEWLRQALGNLESEAEKMHKCFEILKDKKITTEQKETTLDDLLYYVEDISNAQDVHKIGGIPILIDLLRDDSEEVKIGACWVIGTIVQNNPSAQKAAFESGILEPILRLITPQQPGVPQKAEQPGQKVREKALFAISGLIKDFPEALEDFLRQEGLFHLATFLQHPNASARMKAAFLLNELIRTKCSLIDDVINLNILAPLLAMVDDPDFDAREKAANLVEIIIKENSVAKKKSQDLGLSGIISDRLKKLEAEGESDFENYEQQVDVLKNLQKVLDS